MKNCPFVYFLMCKYKWNKTYLHISVKSLHKISLINPKIVCLASSKKSFLLLFWRRFDSLSGIVFNLLTTQNWLTLLNLKMLFLLRFSIYSYFNLSFISLSNLWGKPTNMNENLLPLHSIFRNYCGFKILKLFKPFSIFEYWKILYFLCLIYSTWFYTTATTVFTTFTF